MLDMLLALIEELVGGKKKPPPAQPRRRVRPTADASGEERKPAHVWFEQPTTPVANQNPPEYEKMVRQFFGMEEEEQEQEDELAETPVPVRQPEPAYFPPMQTLKPVTAVVKESVVTPLTGTLGISSIAAAPDESGLQKERRPARTQEDDQTLRELVHGLRNNPDAAREGFLYSEIFGPPLADRY